MQTLPTCTIDDLINSKGGSGAVFCHRGLSSIAQIDFL